ncbi:Tat pathway signal sequence domain protein [Streptomyces actinomycinicus]|uniref:Tat pathway signal sequence domain protein n=1 Tax=Streptomyces actinomycinicus TaxID=1695166 RepID=A0A937JN70_9ACTN|nr:Tat pathway signal sequence domain protein [Streptomyces actinomycinicus]MBL1084280.1 Tat pathway signal sequence domain protein [Streptomyces actinomycinicus]
MREKVHRHLGKVLAGAALAAVGTAAMVAVTLPGSAGADESGGSGNGGTQAAQRSGQGPDAVPPGVVEQAPADAEQGTGRDPLTGDETGRVERIALAGQLSATARDVDGGRGPQRLSVDLAEPEAAEADDPDAPRRADVTFYDYKTDTLVTKTVNLKTGKVEHTGTQRGVQPPPSRAENTEAARILIAGPLGAGLKADYKDATGKELTSPDQLELTGGVYEASPGAQPAVLDDCGVHRCVRLFSKVKNGPWIDTRDLVIDLSARKTAALDRS